MGRKLHQKDYVHTILPDKTQYPKYEQIAERQIIFCAFLYPFPWVAAWMNPSRGWDETLEEEKKMGRKGKKQTLRASVLVSKKHNMNSSKPTCSSQCDILSSAGTCIDQVPLSVPKKYICGWATAAQAAANTKRKEKKKERFFVGKNAKGHEGGFWFDCIPSSVS